MPPHLRPNKMAVVLSSLQYLVIFALFQLSCDRVSGYVPAHPTNSSQEAFAGGLNVTDVSKLHLRWYSNGSYSQNVSYQLAGHDSRGSSRGALVHFSEMKVSNQTPATTTPWIAMISCDFNATNASEEEDVFTLARDKGAVAALLYSEHSLACVINPEYTDPATFDQVFDIFSTQSLTSVFLIEYQFGQTNESTYGVYDSQRLNDSAATINAMIQAGTPPAPGYLFGILQAYNATVRIDDSTGKNSSAESQPHRKQNTGLAMIILYAITGCVSALFCVVIISGAVRAIRHPERYGPRARNSRGDFGQSRAGGLTRAILDTFPVVKFSSPLSPEPLPESRLPRNFIKDVEEQALDSVGGRTAMDLKEWGVVHTDGRDTGQPKPLMINQAATVQTSKHIQLGSDFTEELSSPIASGLPAGLAGSVQHRTDIEVAAMGREVCPICIMDFEEGDDLRVLPCEGKHRFHQRCVDPWLLELSGSCPICREDFLALENILSGVSDHDHGENVEGIQLDLPPSGNRLSRYLRFARRRRRSIEDDEVRHPSVQVPSIP